MRILTSLFLVFLLAPLLQGQSTWNPEKDEDGIKAYTRIKAGKDYFEYRTVFGVKGTLDQAQKMITDVDAFKKWMPKTIDSKIIERKSETVLFGYTKVSAPWPASNRDLVFKMEVKKSGDKLLKIVLTGAPDHHPQDEECVRLKDYSSEWRIHQVTGETMIIDYRVSFEPGGNYPKTILKNSLVDARIETSKKFITRMDNNN